ncbi:vacuolar ATPase subunit DVA41 [Cavenderia fasciculata]|uniref:V-type proton ATPase subunit n=1 Tax=Cavenderia fasciculata TaxID=261658 RepID=F4PQK3_CACFS|nr:vacuolar ATPase subunit DVA41 [Cavenderia fasciculata]EGG21170.1 vacuolar ATPase subunit DVA41 [Cavenderia fasciculata]|eukprot:XP_004359020.1 vacuolar ATPase subunit DVA41 [Cavenderia fasciculata]
MVFFGSRKHGSIFTFNKDDGYLEALLRGFRKGILSAADYTNLRQCDSLEDMKLHLSQTDYGDFLAGEPSPIHTTTMAEKATQKLVDEFMQIRNQSVEPLSTFLDYISYGYMIDNVVLLITGTLHERDVSELVDKCHPLGMFKSMATLSVVHNVADLYNNVLIDTPLAPYIQNCLSEEDLDEMNIEIIRNTLYKAYLEDFYAYCNELGGQTSLIMNDILKFEADRRSINITINSFGATELTKDDREKLYPSIGLLYPEGTTKLSKAEDVDHVRSILEVYSAYKSFFSEGVNAESSLEDAFFKHEVHLNRMAFEDQYGYGVFFAYVKLREQEIRNIVWIAECISQNMKSKIDQFIPIF